MASMIYRVLLVTVVMSAVVSSAAVVREQEDQPQHLDLYSAMISGLRSLPFIGNVLRAAVHPIYRPLVNSLQPRVTSRDGDDEMRELCYGEIGCLITGEEFFHPLHRPFNLPPNRREEVGVMLTVYTRELEGGGQRVSALQVHHILNTTFTPTRPTKILIHGFLDHTGVTWMMDMLRALLAAEDLNVITVDWSDGSQTLYSQAVANTRLVGLELAHLINWLKKEVQLDPKDVHIIGHSLGSHTAGYAGERVPGLGRITGLDPAEPFFQFMPPSVRLDPTDATFVDVIHTDADSMFNLVTGTGYGLRQAVGHVDFYPNDGRRQPGCDSLVSIPLTALTDGLNLYEGLDAAQKEFVACHHNRAAKLFTDSLTSSCPYTAFRCPSYAHYLKGLCVSCGVDGSGCVRLGLQAEDWLAANPNLTQVPVYLSTGRGPKYCLYHYLLELEVGGSGGGSLRGNLKVSIIREDGTIKEFDLTPRDPIRVRRGGFLRFFLKHDEDLSTATEALVHWTYETDVFDPMSYCVLFCDTALPLFRLTFSSVDMVTPPKTRSIEEPPDESNSTQPQKTTKTAAMVTMCHKQGIGEVRIASEATVKVVASPVCLTLPNNTANSNVTTDPSHRPLPRDLTAELLMAGLNSLSSILAIR